MTTPSKYYVGDVGTEIIVDTLSDLSTAAVHDLAILKPGATSEVIWTGVVVDTTKIKYIIGAGDWDVAGIYKLQSVVDLPSWQGRGNTVTFVVDAAFD